MNDERARFHEECMRVFAGDSAGEAYHGPALRVLLAGVTADSASRRPVPTAHTIAELVAHLTAWRENVVVALNGGIPMVLSPADDWPPIAALDDASWSVLLGRLDASQARLLAAVDAASDDVLSFQVDLLRFALHHDLHHGGQIAMLSGE